MNEQKVDWTKPIQTRCGLSARVLWTGILVGNGICVVVAVKHSKTSNNKPVEETYHVSTDGCFLSKTKFSSDLDILNVTEKQDALKQTKYKGKTKSSVCYFCRKKMSDNRVYWNILTQNGWKIAHSKCIDENSKKENENAS